MTRYFDRAVCLSLDKRVHEQERVSGAFLEHGIDVSFFQAGDGLAMPTLWYDHVDVEPPLRNGYPAWANRPNSYNAFCCFRRIIERAKKDGVKTLLLLEDDVVLTPDFGAVLPAAWSTLQVVDPNWHMFYLGANHYFSNTVEVVPSILRLNGSGCFHAVVLRNTVFDDMLSLQMTSPIDGLVARKLHPIRRCYACWPNIAVTKPGFSFCEGRDVDYHHFFSSKGC